MEFVRVGPWPPPPLRTHRCYPAGDNRERHDSKPATAVAVDVMSEAIANRRAEFTTILLRRSGSIRRVTESFTTLQLFGAGQARLPAARMLAWHSRLN
ncbi:hypothetical protein Tbd_0373 [Thiobacillus denitrificans ATCC 25259]|uniref:Uncharacterized protein n=1 Tax=Thiobacillus denitrificans (strain ATCC 25259 / T1) TaxID=292415 RepID=Q3SLS9_THIDA|nr:hypothetical protein Tbd_0373 [Thiobacillus denitrificans ATCC 25259]